MPFTPVIIWIQDNSCVDLTPALEKLVPNPPTASENTPFGINKDQCVVGTLDTSLAFLYEHKSDLAYNLTSCCILKKSQTLQLGAANDINGLGQIVATGTLDNVPGAFLLTPA